MNYVLAPTNSDLIHYGVSAKDGAPGRGSGRYPLGSGKEGKKVKGYRVYHTDGKNPLSVYTDERNQKLAKKNAKKAINTIASLSTGMAGMVDNEGNIRDNIKINKKRRMDTLAKATDEYDKAASILGQEKVEKMIKSERNKTLALDVALGSAMYASAMALMPPSVMAAPIGIALTVKDIYGGYDKASKYLKSNTAKG